MKVSYDFLANKLVETTDGIELPDKDSFTILVIKVVDTTDTWNNNYWLLTEKEEMEQKENMIDYYHANSSTENPFDEDNEPDNYEQYGQELQNDHLFGIKDLKMENEVFTMGEYKVSSCMYSHANLDSHLFYKFKKN